MVFSSTLFLFAFLPVTVLVYFALPKRARNLWLLTASFFFYGWGEPRVVLVLAASVLANALFALWISRLRRPSARRAVLAAAITANLGCLFVYKYLNFTLSALDRVFTLSLPVTKIALPIGISFFTFQALSYVIDVYRGDVPAQRNPLRVGLYVALFPQLIAGPIVRYKTIAGEIDQRTVTVDDFAQGARQFVIGFLKKVLLANTLSVVADDAFGAIAPSSVLYAWLGLICYSMQILFDFSGYSDMAIGLGRMFGFHFLKNFDYPYISASVSEFWRRWHISLGTWFRDYVYIPLGGSRVRGKARLVFNLFVVWTLTGVWHGANWTFLFWGLYYFALIAFEKLTGLPGRLRPGWPRALYRALTLLCVALGWVLFRSEGAGAALLYLKTLFGLNAHPLADTAFLAQLREYAVPLLAGLLLCTPLPRSLGERLRAAGPARASVFEVFSIACYALGFAVALSQLIMGAHNPFIYFNF
ncbi:MAG: MBOAT family protein [Eubacteriales bacterium]|nr:MBOAT family protein [Eubacteriales bacterium]